MKPRVADALLGLCGILIVLGAWEAVARSGIVNQTVFPPPLHALAVGVVGLSR